MLGVQLATRVEATITLQSCIETLAQPFFP